MIEQVAHSLTCGGRDRKDLDPQRLAVGADLFDGIFVSLLCLDQVAFVGGYDLPSGRKVNGIAGKLAVDGHDVLDGVSPLGSGRVHDMDQDPGPLQVGQEFMSESRAVRGSLDESGNVRHDKAGSILQVHDAQNGLQGREVIIGDPGPGVAGHGQEGRFSDIGKADQADVSDHLELEQQLQRPGGLARLGVLGRLHGRCGIVHVAVAPAAAAQDHIAAQVAGHIGDDLAAVGLADHSSLGDLDLDVLALFARHPLLFSVLAVLGRIFADMAEVGEGIEALVHDKDDVASLAAVPSVGAARGHIFFTAEGDMAVPALAA